MLEISESTRKWARDALDRDVRDLLDDPSVLRTETDRLATLGRVARDLGYSDFDYYVKSRGTPFELERLRLFELTLNPEA